MESKNVYDDEIDLFELFQNLWEQKFLILGITFIFTVLGVAFAKFSTPIYKAEAKVLAPLDQDVQQLKLDVLDGNVRRDLVNISVEQVFSEFQTNLNSVSLRRSFFENQVKPYLNNEHQLTQFEHFDKAFNQKISVTGASAKDNNGIVVASIEGDEPELVALWTNNLIKTASDLTVKNLIEQAELVLNREISNLEEEITSKRALAASRRSDRVANLEEALFIAKAMGLEAPMIENAANQLNMEYMRGIRSIEAEIDVLKNRDSDDPFIPDVRSIQERISFLKSISFDPKKVRVIRVDQAAEVPTNPIKPKKALIAAVALVLGGLIGIFIALIRSAVVKRRQQFTETQAV